MRAETVIKYLADPNDPSGTLQIKEAEYSSDDALEIRSAVLISASGERQVGTVKDAVAYLVPRNGPGSRQGDARQG